MRDYPKRWLGVYYKPQKAFSILETDSSAKEWVLILIVTMTIVFCAGIATLPDALDTERKLIETVLKSYSDLSTMQRSIILREATRFDHRQLVGLMIIPASVCFMFGVWSVVGKHCGELIFGRPLPYARVLPIAGYASLVLIPETIVKTMLVFISGSLNPPVHPGVFFFEVDLESLPGMYLSGVDFFGIWFLYLFGLGLAQTFRGSFKITWFVLGFIWCVWILIRRVLESLGTVYV